MTASASYSVYAVLRIMLLTLLFDTTLLASLLETSATVIYVDPDNGTMDPNCWMGGINLPCKDYGLAKKGALYLKVNVQIIPSKNKTCRQTWMYNSSGTCMCGKKIHGAVRCNSNEVSIRDCTCMTYDEKEGVLVGSCPYGCGIFNNNSRLSKRVYRPLPKNVSKINNIMCGWLNRDGRLCSVCKRGFSPLAYSYDYKCVKCTNSKYNWLKFTAAAFIPLTIFYFIVILFRINATNPYLYGFITLNQALASPVNLRAALITFKGKYALVIRLLVIPYTIWNLDFLRSLPLNICLNLSTLQTLALDYAIAVYPLLLVIITYILIELHARDCRLLVWLWRPFHRCCVRFTRIMDIKSSIVKAFATFLLLSYVKLLNTTLGSLLPVKVYNVHEEVVGWYVYYDASYEYFSKEHLPYAIMGIVFFLTFGFPPLILLLLYPTRCFQKCLSSCRLRNHILHTFVDAFQGYYKDGTEPGTRDCRWFAAIYILARVMAVYIIFGFSEGAICYALTGISMIFLVVLMIVLQPYKSSKLNTYHTIIVLYTVVFCFSATTFDEATIKAQHFTIMMKNFIGILCLLPPLVAVVYVIYCVSYRCFKKCQAAWQPQKGELGSLIHKDNGDEYLHSTVYQAVST